MEDRLTKNNFTIWPSLKIKSNILSESSRAVISSSFSCRKREKISKFRFHEIMVHNGVPRYNGMIFRYKQPNIPDWTLRNITFSSNTFLSIGDFALDLALIKTRKPLLEKGMFGIVPPGKQ